MNAAFDKLAQRRNVPVSPDYPAFVVDDYHAPDQPMLDDMTAAALKVLARTRMASSSWSRARTSTSSPTSWTPTAPIDEMIEFDNAVGVARPFAETTRQHAGSRPRRPRVLGLQPHRRAHRPAGIAAALRPEGPPERHVAHRPARRPQASGRRRRLRRRRLPALQHPRRRLSRDLRHRRQDPGRLRRQRRSLRGLADQAAAGDRQPAPHDHQGRARRRGLRRQPVQREERDFGFFLRGQAGRRTQAVHTATDIPVSAFSRNDAFMRFVGVQSNTDVFFKLAQLALGSGGWDEHD